MIMKRLLLPALLALALGAVGTRVEAQSGTLDKLDARTRAAVQSVIDSVIDAGMPEHFANKLVSLAQQGAASGASSETIIAAVRGRARRLDVARSALGDRWIPDIESGEAALQQGVKIETLIAFRRARPTASVAQPLVLLSDLITRGVPADTASALFLAVARSRGDDQTWTVLHTAIVKDIQSGKTPVYAAETGTRGVIAAGVGAATAADAARGAPSTLSGTGSGKPTGGPPPPRP